ncbi:Dyp-type peroxidase [Actinocorallia lasiicapitis]
MPQPVLQPLPRAALFLVVTIAPGGEDTVRALLADVPALRRSVGFRISDGDLSCVVGIGSDAWSRLFGGPKPEHLHPFQEVRGAVHQAPSTPGDVLFHIRGERADVCFELGMLIVKRLEGMASVVDEVHGFRYFDRRDLLGFVDGSGNPEDDEAKAAVFDADGGSYVIIQKYLHDLTAWNALTIEGQENVIGRTKLPDVEMPDSVKPSNSHIVLNTINDYHGETRDIVRDNMPFGTIGRGEFGTFFIGYASDPGVTELMLRRMFIGEPAGNHDRILDFSTAMTGCLFYVPTPAFLADPPAPNPAAERSLGIGSLKGNS